MNEDSLIYLLEKVREKGYIIILLSVINSRICLSLIACMYHGAGFVKNPTTFKEILFFH